MSDPTPADTGNASIALDVRITDRSIDYATVLGLVIAAGLILSALLIGGSPGAFWNTPAFMIVFLGTLAVTLISFSVREFLGALKIAGNSLFKEENVLSENARQLLDLSTLARKHGVLALQKVDKAIENDDFLYKAVHLVSDGNAGDYIKKVLGQEIDALMLRHHKGASIFRRASEVAPAMGLIGTLVGLVQMLAMLDDPATIGPSMAVALLTTFYGALLGTVVFSPLAAKLERNSQMEAKIKNLTLVAMVSIANQENPRRLEAILNSELPPSERVEYFD